jgi:hypothetical protein
VRRKQFLELLTGRSTFRLDPDSQVRGDSRRREDDPQPSALQHSKRIAK